ncbi:hypothetical protein OA88_16705 [Flavobacterium sp. JRM]|nr:hypothetical protein OA88_16705 [Flavobacterium sp. JRM]
MQAEIVVKIKKIRIEKGFSPNEMAEKLNIDLSAYSRLESGRTFTWGKYLEDILIIFDLSPECFFKGIGMKNNIRYKKDSFEDSASFEYFFTEYKKKVKKVEILFEERLKDKDEIIEQLKKNKNK